MILRALVNDVQKFDVNRLSQSLVIDLDIIYSLIISQIKRKVNSTAEMIFHIEIKCVPLIK